MKNVESENAKTFPRINRFGFNNFVDALKKKYVMSKADKGLRNMLIKAIQKEGEYHAKNETTKPDAGSSIKIVFVISSGLLRILMEHIEMKNNLDSKLQIDSSFSKIIKCSTLARPTT